MLSDRIEVRCLLLALRPRLSDGEREWLRDAVHGGLDWTGLVEVALAHSVTGLLDRGLREYCADLLPEDIDNALFVHKAALTKRNQELSNELVRVADALDRAGIEALSYKGPTLAMQVYGDLGLRSFRDLDMLIHWRDRVRVREVLRGLGYLDGAAGLSAWQLQAMHRCNGQEILFAESAEIAVEPHWDLFPNTFAIDIDYGGLWRRSQYLAFESGDVRCLSKEDMILVACLHGAKEQWWRLNWVCDVAESVANTTDAPIFWRTLVERARSQNCLRALLVGVGLANRLFGVQLATELRHAIAADRRIEPLLDFVTGQKIDPTHPGPPDSLARISQLRFEIHEGVRRKLLYVLRTLFAPRPVHIGMMALPPRIDFLYYLVRAIHDYLLLPCWRLWKAARPSRAQ